MENQNHLSNKPNLWSGPPPAPGKGPLRPGIPFNGLAEHWRNQYGVKVQKVAIDAGMGCPHREDRRGDGGCTFCDEWGSGSVNVHRGLHVKNQLHKSAEDMKGRKRASKFFSYLQSYTNTFAPPDALDEIYEGAIDHPDVVGLAIGTRPDLLPPKTLDVLAKYSEKTDLLLELGVQSFYPETIDWMNRAHSIDKTHEALENLKKWKIKTVVHLMFGSPTDPAEAPKRSAEICNYYEVDGVKLHNLAIIDRTQMAKDFQENPWKMWSLDEYLQACVEHLERLNPEIVIHRTHAVVDRPEMLIAPPYSGTDKMVLPKDELIAKMKRENTWQGRLHQATH